eukprot:6909542-Ditylum_brightwellii.AAC.1
MYRNGFYKDHQECNALPYTVKVMIKEEHQKKRPQKVSTATLGRSQLNDDDRSFISSAIQEAFEHNIAAAKTSNNEVDEDTALTEPTTGTS